jgi:hypothetical protein
VRAAVAKEFGVSEKKIRQAQELLAADPARADLVMKGQEKLNRALRDYQREGPYLPPGTPGAPPLERVRIEGPLERVRIEGPVERVRVEGPVERVTLTDPTLLQRKVLVMGEDGSVRSRWVPAWTQAGTQTKAQNQAQAQAPAPATATVTVPLDPAGAAAVLVQALAPEAVRELARLLVSWLRKQGHIGESR